jgi:hypothetical protein
MNEENELASKRGIRLQFRQSKRFDEIDMCILETASLYSTLLRSKSLKSINGLFPNPRQKFLFPLQMLFDLHRKKP